MKNFEQRKAEIFKRSEIRIKKRKRIRAQVLALCLPLCVCITILAVIFIPSVDDKGYVGSENLSGVSDGSSPYLYSLLQVTTDTLTQNINIEDEQTIENIYYTISSMFESQDDFVLKDEQILEPGSDKSNDITKDDNSDKGQSKSEYSGYTITFTDKFGNKKIYTLKENVLTSDMTSQEIILTESQLLKLKLFLGI